jgi:HSP20 family protein
MATMYNEFKPLFERFFGKWPVFEAPVEAERYWNLEVRETEKEFLVRAEVPGFEPKEIEVNVTGDRLMFRAEHKEETTEKKDKNGYHYDYAERRFERAFTLPPNTDPAKAEATYRNGVIELHLPKTEAAKTCRIEVKA